MPLSFNDALVMFVIQSPPDRFEHRISDRMTQKLQFIVKAISPGGYVGWLASPNANGFRTISMRAGAAIFSTHAQATLAITNLSLAFEKAGVRFSIERDEQGGSAAGTLS